MDPTIGNLTSVAGVIALTIFLVGQFKPALARVAFLAAIPTWAYTVLVAAGLTVLANRLGFLPGELKALVYQSIMNALAAAGLRNVAQNVGTSVKDSVGPTKTDIGPDFSSYSNWGVGLLIAGMLLLGSGGCVGTSKPFKFGAHAMGPKISQLATEYAQNDSTLLEPTKLQRQAEAQRLLTATADEDAVQADAVESAWKPVRPWFADYGDADPKLLNDPFKLLLRRELITTFDTLIAEEQRRRSLWYQFLVPLAPQPPPPASPTTRP